MVEVVRYLNVCFHNIVKRNEGTDYAEYSAIEIDFDLETDPSCPLLPLHPVVPVHHPHLFLM